MLVRVSVTLGQESVMLGRTNVVFDRKKFFIEPRL